VSGSALGLLKGVGIIEGFTPREVYPVAQLPGCRAIWDDLFESGRGVEVLDKVSVLSYASTKAQGFVRFAHVFLLFSCFFLAHPRLPGSSRDLVILVVNEFVDDGTVYSLGKSVVDPKCPEVKGKVRAVMEVMGWYFEPLPDRVGTKVTYITQIDLGGWVPGSVLKLVASQIPLVVAGVRKYLRNHHAIGEFTISPCC